MSWKTAIFGKPKEVEQRNIKVPEDPTLASGSVIQWLNLSQLGALNIGTFNRGVNLISNSVSQLPIYTKKKDGSGKTNIVKNHPTNLLFDDKDNIVDTVTMLRNICRNVICKGNAYMYIDRAADGTPVRLRYLESSDVTTLYQKEKQELYYQVGFIKNGSRIPPKNMLHFKLFTWDGVNGVSVLNFAKHQTDLTNTVDEQAKGFFEKGCNNISGVLTVQSVLNEKQRNQILNTWNQTYSNGKAGLAVIQGNMQYQPITINPDDAQLLESREFNQADVCQFLNINPAQLGLKGFTPYKSFEDANNELLQRTLMPYIRMIESEMSRKLLSQDERNLKIILDTAAFLRPNKQSEAQYYGTLIDKGVLSRNEVREILGFNKVKGDFMDDMVIPYTKIQDNTLNTDNNFENNTDEDGEGNT